MTAKDSPLGDMIVSNSPRYALARNLPGQDSSRYAFFPGCQLSGLAPELIPRVYADLRRHLPGVGIMLQCCGTPAKWAGQKELFQGSLQRTLKLWREMGQPVLILACSTCYSMFREHLPEVGVISLWEVLVESVASRERLSPEVRVALHDSCTTRGERRIHEAVRALLARLGYTVEELRNCRERAVCCGNRGLLAFKNPAAAARIAAARVAESAADYVTHCVTCQHTFAAQGKRTYYLLDLVYADDRRSPATRGDRDAAERAENRLLLRKELLEEVWGER